MPQSKVEEAEIPVIDISESSNETAEQVLRAASTHGFLFIKNDGSIIPPSDIKYMFGLAQNFFSQPKHLKEDYSIHTTKAGGKNRGWVTMQGESLDPDGQKKGDPKEVFNIGEPALPPQPLPEPLASSSEQICRFQSQCHTLCNRILTLLATALSIPSSFGGSTWFSSRHDPSKGPSGTILRLLYYPSSTLPKGQDDFRAGAHSDYGSLTLLFRLPGQSGLEILTSSNTWAPVPINPSPSTLTNPPILVNIGDLLSFWTNGMLKSTVHRVVFSHSGEESMGKREGEERSAERYSIAYFSHPLDSAVLEPVPSNIIRDYKSKELEGQLQKVGLQGEERGEVLTARQHLDRRLKVTYGLKD